MLLVPVASTDIAAIGYDPAMMELQIQFQTGRIYSYANIAPELYAAFINAPSKGSFLAQFIRNQPGSYPTQRLL